MQSDCRCNFRQILRNILIHNMDTVLIIGATGNIGVAAVLGALRSKRNVLAIVRNQASANKLFQHIGTRDGITTVEADIMSDQGVQTVVDQVRAGKLPPFQHVYSAGKSLMYLNRTLLNAHTSWRSIRCGSIARSQH
jgi:short-subunit dehydrogenase